MQASFPTLPAGHPGLPACQDCFRVVKGKNPQSVCSMTQNDHQSAIRQNPAPSVSLVCFHLWLLTFPWLPFDSWQGRIINPLHPSCVGGVNESMARSTSRWESFFSVEKKQHFTETVLCLHWILVYFLMLWALELASVLVFWQIPPSMITEDCGCRKKHLHFTAEDLKKQMFFNFSSFIKKLKHLGEYPKITVTYVTIVVDFFSLSMSHSSLWYSSDEMPILKQQRQWENAVGDEKTHPLKMF